MNICYAPGVDQARISESAFLLDWLKSVDPQWTVTECTVLTADIWATGQIGYIELDVAYKIGENSFRERILLSGGSTMTAVLIHCTDDGKLYTVLVNQPRVGSGKIMLEYPAGMTDGSIHYREAAVRELREECGLNIDMSELVDLGEVFLGNDQRYYNYGNLFAQYLFLYLVEKHMTMKEMKSLEGRECGVDDEEIVVRVVPFDDLPKLGIDGATAAATFLIQSYLANKQ